MTMNEPFSACLRLAPQGAVIWFTGCSASGKSTLAQALHQRLNGQGLASFVLDGDLVRQGLCSDLGFSREDRRENIRRLGEVAALMAQAGLVVITAFISPYGEDRDRARAAAPGGRFFEVHLDVPIAVCEERDPKGLYKKARAGQLKGFTGIDDPYEPPIRAELSLPTHQLAVDDCVARMLTMLGQARVI